MSPHWLVRLSLSLKPIGWFGGYKWYPWDQGGSIGLSARLDSRVEWFIYIKNDRTRQGVLNYFKTPIPKFNYFNSCCFLTCRRTSENFDCYPKKKIKSSRGGGVFFSKAKMKWKTKKTWPNQKQFYPYILHKYNFLITFKFQILLAECSVKEWYLQNCSQND